MPHTFAQANGLPDADSLVYAGMVDGYRYYAVYNHEKNPSRKDEEMVYVK